MHTHHIFFLFIHILFIYFFFLYICFPIIRCHLLLYKCHCHLIPTLWRQIKEEKKVPACFPMWNTFMLNEHATCKVAFTWVWHNTSPSTSHKNHEPQTVLNIHTNTQEGLSLRLARRGNGWHHSHLTIHRLNHRQEDRHPLPDKQSQGGLINFAIGQILLRQSPMRFPQFRSAVRVPASRLLALIEGRSVVSGLVATPQIATTARITMVAVAAMVHTSIPAANISHILAPAVTLASAAISYASGRAWNVKGTCVTCSNINLLVTVFA